MPPSPILLVIAGPAGSGKSTLCDRLVAADLGFSRVITTTTRAPREGEVHGVHYHFFTPEAFEAKVGGGEFLEWAWVHGRRRYGTLKASVLDPLSAGQRLVMSVDVQGVASLRQMAASDSLLRQSLTTVFLVVDHDRLLARMRDRGKDNEEEIARRMATAEAELREASKFDFVIHSQTRDEDFAALLAILARVPAPDPMKIHPALRRLCLFAALMSPALHAADPQVIELWPEGVPDLKPDASAERHEGSNVGNIHHPSLTVYPAPAETASGTAVIIAPGGSYARLSWANEGTSPAAWLNSLGVTAFVLKYRVKEYGQPAPLRDVLRAIRLVRSRAAEFGVRPDRIGMLGFSAGGHLAASAGTLYDAPEGRTGAALDAVSGRPDFLLLLYPVITMQPPYAHEGSRLNLLGAHPDQALMDHLSPELHVTKDTPPAFLVATEEDKTVPVQNSLMFFEALKKAGVPAEIHIYEKGAHGFGLKPGLETSEWPALAGSWLRINGLIPTLPVAP